MGNRKSHSAKEVGTPPPARPLSFTRAWDLLFSGDIHAWQAGAAAEFGMEGDMCGCQNRDCEREAVCLQLLKASYSKTRRLLEVERYGGQAVSLVLERRSKFAGLVEQDFQLSPAVLASRGDLAVLRMSDQRQLVCHSVFPLLHLSSPSISIIHEVSRPNMAVIGCALTPDLSMTAVLFYSASETERGFCYDLYLFSNSSGELVKSVSLNREVQPYFSFDPRYSWSRLAVANYENRADYVRHELVVLSLDSEKILQRSVRSLPVLISMSRFCMQHSRDGVLLILQKLTEDRFGLSAFSDIYIFLSSQLQLIKYITATLPGLYHICRVNYEPMFSKCGSYMRVMDHKGYVEGQSVRVSVYQLPRQLNLMTQCRIVIMQHLPSPALTDSLPLPQALKDYLHFRPFM